LEKDKKILLIDSDTSFEEIDQHMLRKDTVICFDFDSHKKLEQLEISHEIADDYLNRTERMQLFDTVVSLYTWYQKDPIFNELEFEGTNLIGVMDSLEFHLFLLSSLIKFSIIKKIVETKSPEHITCTSELSQLVKLATLNTSSQLKIISSKEKQRPDTVEIRFNIGKKPIVFLLSSKRFSKLKYLYEYSICKLFNLWYKSTNEKIILLVEFNTFTYSSLIYNLSESKKTPVILNRRRPVFWNSESLKILRKSNCKVLDSNNILDKNTKQKLAKLEKHYAAVIESLWKNEDVFNRIFSIHGDSFWPAIKDHLYDMCKHKMSSYLRHLIESKEIFKKLDIDCMLYQYESGETENSLLQTKPNTVISYLLRHGFSCYYDETSTLRWRYDTERLLDKHSDKFLLWGNADHKYYTSNLPKNKRELIITGSPRYDSFFKKNLNITSSTKKTILLTPEPLTYGWSGLLDINIAIRYENLLKKLFNIISKIDDVDVIVKLHPGVGWLHNQTLIKIIKEIDSNISIYQIKPVEELLKSSDIVINITPEDNEPSTVMLEGLIHQKLILDISLDETNKNLEYQQGNPMVNVSYNANLEKYLKLLLFDDEFRQLLLSNNKIHLQKYLANQGTSSESIARLLTE
jgi:hypothetical protein